MISLFANTTGGAIAGAVLALAIAPGCHYQPNVSLDGVEELEFSAAGLDQLLVEPGEGSVHVRATEDANAPIHVVARIRAWGVDHADAQAALESVEIMSTIAESPARATQKLAWCWFHSGRGWRAHVEFEITMPRDLDLEVTTTHGEIEVDGLAADRKLITHGGRVVVREPLGDSAVPARVECQSHNGEIDVVSPAARVIATTHNGGLNYQGAASELQLETHNGAVTAALVGAGAVDGSIQSHNGPLFVSLDPRLDVRYQCQTRLPSGVDNEIIRWQQLHGQIPANQPYRPDRGTLGQGRGKLRIETHNGLIRLIPLEAPAPAPQAKGV